MQITLNLATRPYADQRPVLKQLRIGMGVLALVLVGLVLGLLHFHQRALAIEAREAALDQSIARMTQEENGYRAQMQQPANARVLNQAEFLNQLFDEKSFSWTAAMEDLERVLPAGVQVTAIEPARAKDGRLTLKLRVSGQREPAVAMVRNMEHSRRFISPRIANENAESSAAAGDLRPVQAAIGRVTFDILAEYNPATLDERRAALVGRHEHATGNQTPGGPATSRPALRSGAGGARSKAKPGPANSGVTVPGTPPGGVPNGVPHGRPGGPQ